MNGTVSRRVFVGSVAAAGVGAAGTTSLLDFPVSAQPVATAPLVREIRRQLKEALGKMRDGHADGARQLATTLRIYASTVDNDQLRAALRKANREQILLAQPNHRELMREAEELGINPSTLPPHSLDRVGREAALDQLRQEGLSPLMNRVADFVDSVGAKMEALERSGRARPLQVALRQPIPDTVDCGNCNQEKQQVDTTENIALVACAASAIVPALAGACAVASATFITFYLAYAACQAIVQLCRAYYN
jgi:hypothetical protein